MTGTVTVRRVEGGLWIIAPEGAPTVLDDAADVDVVVLEVLGGHLTWSLASGQPIPAAVIDDMTLAQEWIWAVYGAAIALAVDEFDSDTTELTVQPALPRLAANAWRLGYAHWAARWWPASTIDGIAPLDERLLDQEIAALREECELIVDDDAEPVSSEDLSTFDIPSRAQDYALAAGSAFGTSANALVLARGSGGWDWHRCPPGLIDASEHAVSWQVSRSPGTTTIGVEVVAALRMAADIPAHLHPRALIAVAAETVETELNLVGDTWTGQATTSSEAVSSVELYVPGVGAPGLGDSGVRQQVRDIAAARLRRAAADDDAAFDAPLLAEIAAAASESDF
ncbi:hypothetical protein [Nocardia sp. NBC_01009]|uniref:hypothetical protein n=1 Tax=Nocardia sp. NBC_01009 TaxID=2975996 RepID=UPI0038644AD2|nr:hypothetical protein OHA42_03680 [Nocardia sp. NBC_01009]